MTEMLLFVLLLIRSHVLCIQFISCKASQCWRGGVDWTAKYLTAHGQGLATGSPTGASTHTPKLLQVGFVLTMNLKTYL